MRHIYLWIYGERPPEALPHSTPLPEGMEVLVRPGDAWPSSLRPTDSVLARRDIWPDDAKNREGATRNAELEAVCVDVVSDSDSDSHYGSDCSGVLSDY